MVGCIFLKLLINVNVQLLFELCSADNHFDCVLHAMLELLLTAITVSIWHPYPKASIFATNHAFNQNRSKFGAILHVSAEILLNYHHEGHEKSHVWPVEGPLALVTQRGG